MFIFLLVILLTEARNIDEVISIPLSHESIVKLVVEKVIKI
jgi:hypothetical protein